MAMISALWTRRSTRATTQAALHHHPLVRVALSEFLTSLVVEEVGLSLFVTC